MPDLAKAAHHPREKHAGKAVGEEKVQVLLEEEFVAQLFQSGVRCRFGNGGFGG
jgi:hypothetical protein